MAVDPTQLKPKTRSRGTSSLLIMISVAILLGLVAAGGVWQYLSKTQEKVKKLTVTRGVVVANKQVAAGTKLTDGDLAIKQLPEQTVPKDYPTSTSAVLGRIVKSTLQPGEIITETRLLGQGAAGGLPVVIPQGFRAITIKVNDVLGVAGFINPGDRVDIVSIIKQSDNRTFSKIILQNVLVLAVGDRILDSNAIPDPKAKVVGQVTLALNATDSEKLALASELGQLHLALRPFAEEEISNSPGTKPEDIYGEISSIPATIESNNNEDKTEIVEKEPPPQVTPQNINEGKSSIEIILGNQRTYFYYEEKPQI